MKQLENIFTVQLQPGAMKMRMYQVILLSVCALAATDLALAQDQSVSEHARKAKNPIASLISVSIQSYVNFNWRSEGDTFAVTNIQPVLPFSRS
jgi:hypothetical protein